MVVLVNIVSIATYNLCLLWPSDSCRPTDLVSLFWLWRSYNLKILLYKHRVSKDKRNHKISSARSCLFSSASPLVLPHLEAGHPLVVWTIHHWFMLNDHKQKMKPRLHFLLLLLFVCCCFLVCFLSLKGMKTEPS